MRKLLVLLAGISICITLFGCSTKPQQAQVVATTLPVYEFASLICSGTDITVSQLITENVSCLHDYTLQVHQMQLLENAELVVLSGAGLDAFIAELVDDNLCIDASKNISLLCAEAHHTHSHNHNHDDADPHIWLSPENAKQMAENIYIGLCQTYPQYTSAFADNLQQLLEQLDTLQSYGDQQLADLSSRNCITFHDGFAYLATAFDLQILRAIEEESGSEASAQEIIELICLIDTHNITAIFTERNGTASSAEILHSETDVAVYELDMAISGTSYFDAMYHNIDTIKEALE